MSAPLVRLRWTVSKVLCGHAWRLTDPMGNTRFAGLQFSREGAVLAARRRRAVYERSLG